jgi:hypothetical protein
METKTTNRLHIADERKVYARDHLVTLGDLEQFRTELLKDIQYLLTVKHATAEKQWLKSVDVRKLLKISSGTLQHLRNTGQLPFTRLGGIIYYEQEAIRNLMKKQ